MRVHTRSRRRKVAARNIIARSISGMLRLLYKGRLDATYNEYDLPCFEARMIDKQLTALLSIGGISPRTVNAATISQTLSKLKRAPPCAAGGRSSVKALPPEDIERYSEYLAPFYGSADAKKSAVLALHKIFTSVIDVAFANSPTDLAVEERGLKQAFQSSVSHASFSSDRIETAKPGCENATDKPKHERGFEP